jgi:hypothetical protein
MNSASEDELSLSGDEKDNSLQSLYTGKTVYHQPSKKVSSTRIIVLAVILSSILSIIATTITHKAISAHCGQVTEQDATLLPGLDVPACTFPQAANSQTDKKELTFNLVGTDQAVFMPEQIYRQPPSNATYAAWMKLFPSRCSLNFVRGADWVTVNK